MPSLGHPALCGQIRSFRSALEHFPFNPSTLSVRADSPFNLCVDNVMSPMFPESFPQIVECLINYCGIAALLLGGLVLTNSLVGLLIRRVCGRAVSHAVIVGVTCGLFLLSGLVMGCFSVFIAGAAYGIASTTARPQQIEKMDPINS